jgi:putative (di)nucleoside polyphosphate hydrolase|tara:strand:- start:596 stop:1105 length:510 start_codon:yes stop_codon:yes gene_type:complete
LTALFSKIEEYRLNVAIIIINQKGQALWCRRRNEKGWQFPQGGIDKDETPEKAIMRETYEEVGLESQDIQIISSLDGWLYYDIPKSKIGKYIPSNYKGQKQKWFLAQLIADDTKINLKKTNQIEFDKWQWVNYWFPVSGGVHFKQELYRQALTLFLPNYNAFILDKMNK